jgi:biopolymer transport protein ExbB
MSTPFWELIRAGGFTIYALIACSLLVWAVIFERLWHYRSLSQDLRAFQLEASNALLRGDREGLGRLCAANPRIPTAHLVHHALERLSSRDARLRSRWLEALERRRMQINQELRSHLWVLGTVGSAAPFIGLFGTVVGILRAFGTMSKTGAGGFAVVAGAISEALIATAAGILVGVVSVMAYNAFQTRLAGLILQIRLYTEELAEMLSSTQDT